MTVRLKMIVYPSKSTKAVMSAICMVFLRQIFAAFEPFARRQRFIADEVPTAVNCAVFWHSIRRLFTNTARP